MNEERSAQGADGGIPHLNPAVVQRVQGMLDLWKKSLIDFGRRNKLLYFNTSIRTRLRLFLPSAEVLYEGLVLRDKSFSFAVPVTGDVQVAELEEESTTVETRERSGDIAIDYERSSAKDVRILQQKLYRLRSDARTILNEQGINTLHLSLGLMHWQEAEYSTEWIESPILLVPVSLEREKNSPYRLTGFEGDAVVNPTLAYKISHDFGVQLPSFEPFDGFGERADLLGYFEEVSTVLRQFRGWQVTPDAWLSHFSFEKLVMYEDLSLQGTAPEMAGNDVLAAMCNVSDLDVPEVALEDLDSQFDQPQTFPVIDADSSQLEVMARVKAGQSLVVQGPPGTGKSQTIVNLIGQALRDAKSVLFVSEKRAALEVVHRRLQEVGLGDLCLELHSHRANKRLVVADLHQATQLAWDRVDRPHSQEFEARRELRNRLDSYVRALHSPRDQQGRTTFNVHGRLSLMADAPWLSSSLPVGHYLEIAARDEAQLEERVQALAATDVWDSAAIHPWRDARFTRQPLEIEADLIPPIERLRDALDEISGIRDRLEIGFEFAVAAHSLGGYGILVKQLALLRNTPDQLQADWLSSGDAEFNDAASLIDDVLEDLDKRDAVRRLLTEDGLDGLRRDVRSTADLHSRYVHQYHKALHRLSSRYRADKKRLRALAGRRLSYKRAVPALDTAIEYHQLDKSLRESRSKFAASSGGDFPGDREARMDLREAMEWTASVRSSGSFAPDTARKLVERRDQVRRAAIEEEPALKATLASAEATLHVLNVHFPNGLDGQPIRECSFSLLRPRIDAWLAARPRIREWFRYQRALEACSASGLDDFVAEARRREVAAGELVRAFEKLFFTGWLAEAYAQDEALGSFDAADQELMAQEFARLDVALFNEARTAVHVAARLRQEVVRQAAQYENLGGGRHRQVPNRAARDEYVLIKREHRKQRRHLPLRRLLPKVPILLSAVKPCLLMSPLSVASYLPRHTFTFDLVIFDEASQVPPADAIGAILRGKQLVVMGDSKQLPPTTFFQRQMDDDDTISEEDEDAIAFESILDISGGVLPEAHLLWHYRSRDERLIAFSNREFYSQRLTTFPSPYLTEDTGVRFDHVATGAYGRGGSKTNPLEAGRVVDLILRHLEDYGRERSLGVVALSLSQKDAIELELRRRLLHRPDIEPLIVEEGAEPFFIKNLETVQGDERDEIIISVGYGPSEAGGAPPLAFGPINRRGGERRLNVAITRAKHRLTLVASMRPEQLDGVAQSKWEGPRVLASYFRYAGRGGKFEGEGEAYASLEPESEFEAAIRDALIGRDYVVDCQVGTSGFRLDLAVRHPDIPGRYIIGIECDGAAYHSARTARDRDRLRQQILENQGWRILRIWSPDWVQDRERVLERVIERIEELRSLQEPGIRRVDVMPIPLESEVPVMGEPPPPVSIREEVAPAEAPAFDTQFLQEQRDFLLQEQTQLERQVDVAEGADAKSSATIAEALHRKLDNVRAALRRIERGTYGVCVRCGLAIEIERLEAVASTSLCRDCSRQSH